MFPISAPSQPRRFNNPAPLTSGAIRFGKTPMAQFHGEVASQAAQAQRLNPDKLTEDLLNDTGVPEALKEAMAKYQYTIAEDFFVNYDKKLTFDRAQKQIHHLWEKVTGEDLQKFHDAQKLGLVEESSDMFFEMYTLKALYSGLITKSQVKKWSATLPQAPGDGKRITEADFPDLINGKAFEKARQAIKAEIKETAEKKHPWAYEHFRKMVNQGWVNPQAGHSDRALDLLALVGMKCALMTRKDPGYKLWGDNIQLLCAEAEELREEMHGESPMDSPIKWLIAGMAKLYSLPLMPAGLFQKIIVHIVGQELNYTPKTPKGTQAPPLKFDIDYKDLMETVYSKQIGRQELDYSRPDIDASLRGHSGIRVNKDAMKWGNAKRKCILKPYELWQESAVLKNALKGKDKETDIAEKVLYTGATHP
jgi:hypothetical protein